MVANQRKSGAILGYISLVAKSLVNLVYTPMLLAFVGDAHYGVYQSCYSFVFSLTLLSFGLSAAYVRFFTQIKEHEDEKAIIRLNGMYLILFLTICTMALLLGLIFSANAANIFSNGFTSEQVKLAESLIVIMSITIAVNLLSSVFDACIVAHEQFKFQQGCQLLVSLSSPCLAYLFLVAGVGVIGVAEAQLLVAVISLLMNAQYAIRKLQMRFSFGRFDKALFASIVSFSGWLFANQLCELINQNVPNVLLGALAGPSAVAVFAVAVQLRQVFYSLSFVMANVFSTLINQIVATSDDNKRLLGIMIKVGRYQAMLYGWVLGGFVLLGHFFISKWAGEGFGASYWLVVAMAVPLAIPLVQNTGIEIQKAKNRHKARSLVYLAMALVNLVITFILSDELGYWAPAVGYVIYLVLGSGLFMNWYYHRRIGLDMLKFWKRIMPVFCGATLVVVLCLFGRHFFPVAGWGSFLVWAIVYSLLYFFMIAFLLKDELGKRLSAKRRIRSL